MSTLKTNRRLLIAVVAGAIVAEVAMVMTRPSAASFESAKVSERTYFTDAEIERSENFYAGQVALRIATSILEAGLLVLLILRSGVFDRISRVRRSRLSVFALAGGAIWTALELVALPTVAWAHARAVAVDLAKQSWDLWLLDYVKSWGIGLVPAMVASALTALMLGRIRRWWVPAACVVVVFGAASMVLSPIVVDPIFNRVTPVPSGPTKERILELARQAGVSIDGLYSIDAGTKTSGENAYVAGLGPTKRLVLYDNVLDTYSPRELDAIVAHELGHVAGNDLLRTLALFAVLAAIGAWWVQRLTEAIAKKAGIDLRSVRVLPVVALTAGIAVFIGGVIFNQFSRSVEARADVFALELTRDPDTAIDVERRIARAGVADPNPPLPLRWMFGTHPSAVERIGRAEGFRDAEPGGTIEDRSRRGTPGGS